MSEQQQEPEDLNQLIQPDKMTEADLQHWYKMKKELDALKFQESTLRRKLFAFFFPKPKEGTNTYHLEHNCELKADHTIDRKVDKALLESMAEDLAKENVPVGLLIRNVPELVLREYRKLTPAQQAVFDQVLVIKEGSPQLKIVVPKQT